MRQTLGFLFFMLFLAGLAFAMLRNLKSEESRRSQADVTIVSGDWALQAKGADEDPAPFVRFQEDGKISGFAGCNNFFGTFVATDKTLETGPLGTTRKACPKPAMDQEYAFLQSIENATNYQISGKQLTINSTGKEPLQLYFAESDTE